MMDVMDGELVEYILLVNSVMVETRDREAKIQEAIQKDPIQTLEEKPVLVQVYDNFSRGKRCFVGLYISLLTS